MQTQKSMRIRALKSKAIPKKEEFVLTKDAFLRILERVIQPVPVKAKPPKKGKKGT